MTEAELKEIEERAAKATPAPWRACVWDPMERPHVHKDDPNDRGCTPRRDLPASKDDARFMAAARSDVPALLAEVRRLREGIARQTESPAFGLWCHELRKVLEEG